MQNGGALILGIIGGVIFAAMMFDMGCESVTQDRCTFGIPNPAK